MYGPTDLKKNVLITLDGQPYKVVEYSQKVMGRGGSIVNVKIKNLITGALLPKTFSSDMVGESKDFMKDGDEMEIQFYNGTPINLVLPKNLWLEVTYTESVVKGDTTSSVMKDATLETGVVIKVPAFIKQGDIVSVDTETYAYRERRK